MIARLMAGILALLGSVWAMFSWPALFLPLGLFISPPGVPEEIETRFDDVTVILILVSIMVWFGWFIWIGWIFRALGLRFLVFNRTLWILSAIHHCLWFVLLFVDNFQADGFDFMHRSDDFERFFACYFGIVAFVSFALILLEKWRPEHLLSPD